MPVAARGDDAAAAAFDRRAGLLGFESLDRAFEYDATVDVEWDVLVEMLVLRVNACVEDGGRNRMPFPTAYDAQDDEHGKISGRPVSGQKKQSKRSSNSHLPTPDAESMDIVDAMLGIADTARGATVATTGTDAQAEAAEDEPHDEDVPMMDATNTSPLAADGPTDDAIDTLQDGRLTDDPSITAESELIAQVSALRLAALSGAVDASARVRLLGC